MHRRSVIFALAVLAILAIVGIFTVLRKGSRRDTVTTNQPASQSSNPESSNPLRGDIYPAATNATNDVSNALAQAAREHKRVILDFGGNWCGDCRVLDFYFHDAANLPLLNANYVLVRVNIGEYDHNQDLAAKYGIPLEKGVPALAVLTPDGDVLFSQHNGEFEGMRSMDSASVTEFLTKWKAG
jgi:thioredoxin 1